MAASSKTEERVFIGPGLTPLKRVGTVLGLLVLIGLVIWIGVYQHAAAGATVVGSTIVALVFIFGFIVYLRIVAPVPFTITLGPESIVKRSRKDEVIEVRWEDLTRVKEEFFPNGKRIGVGIYRTPASPQQKARAWVVYRDDVTDIDALAEALKQAIPEKCQWQSEVVHE
ncbi:MAG: hypothetical protein ABI456_17595 [Ktedonobacteraceae bacterium]|nr:hypothetical protein [Chloroflexota bacterium]